MKLDFKSINPDSFWKSNSTWGHHVLSNEKPPNWPLHSDPQPQLLVSIPHWSRWFSCSNISRHPQQNQTTCFNTLAHVLEGILLQVLSYHTIHFSSAMAFRQEWELFDRKVDPKERINVSEKPSYRNILQNLKLELLSWQNITSDPWICAPHSVLEGNICLDLLNESWVMICW